MRFDRLGLDSIQRLSLLSDLEDEVKVELDPRMVFDHDTLMQLVPVVASAIRVQRTVEAREL